jgi:ubiquinone/menaquinone biosynthesis C-methylase UbiE
MRATSFSRGTLDDMSPGRALSRKTLLNIKGEPQTMERASTHFSKIARIYKDLRTTDLEPILVIKKKLQDLNRIEAADLGCGVGRYSMKLFDHLGTGLYLICIDYCKEMLNQLVKNLKEKKIKNFCAVNARGNALPLSANHFDVLVTLNTIHHFGFLGFLKEASRVLKDNGYLFIYTRLRSQNRRNIWGRFFPQFCEKEERLYELSELKQMLEKIPILKLESTEYFRYKRMAKLEWLLTQAAHHHYSTFCLYDEEEFEEALKDFQENITNHFKTPDNIIWDDENIMLVVRRNVR